MDRKTASWMKREDERILEYLEEEEWVEPEMISRNAFTKVSTAHVCERLEMLRYAGLADTMGLASYELTGDGHRYLDGELDAENLPRPTVDRVLRK